MLNLSGFDFTEEELRLVGKGLKFAVAPGRLPVTDVVAAVEDAILRVDEVERRRVRRDVSKALLRSGIRSRNLDQDEFETLGRLSRREDIKFLDADKGNLTVIMETGEYFDKLTGIIEQGPYVHVAKDPGARFRKELQNILLPRVKDCTMERSLYLRLCPTHFQCPHMYGRPKVHKEGAPLRPIISMRGSLFAPVSRYLADILSVYRKTGDSYIGNSVELVDRIRGTHGFEKGVLVSFDVKNLFPNVPLAEAIEVIKSHLMSDDSLPSRTCLNVETLVELIRFCLTKCYFQLRDAFFIMSDGVAMGSSLSGVVANLYMFYFEKMARESALERGLTVPTFWVRFVDDVLAQFAGEADASAYLNLLNSLRTTIQFTIEWEDGGSIPFLDVFIQKEETGVSFSIYRKPTHTGTYLPRDSCHHKRVFMGLISTLKWRAERICSPNRLKQELDNVYQDLRRSGFSHEEARRIYTLKTRKRGSEDGAPAPHKGRRWAIPYVPGVSDRIGSSLAKAGIRTVFKPPKGLRSWLSKKRPDKPIDLGVVYNIPCGECEWSYTGETGRTLQERVVEHRRAVRSWNTNSEIANHVHDRGHGMKWDDARKVDSEHNYNRRIVKEALWTAKLGSGNRTKCTLDQEWGRVAADLQ